MLIRPATAADSDMVWQILAPVIRAGETYALDRDMPREAALDYWFGADKTTFVAEAAGGQIAGTYYLRANQAGGGRHVANCGYMVAADAQGRGVARAMARHSFATALAQGFTAMQFNFVVASNLRAVALWQELGFIVLCTLPAAFDHPRLGMVDALVMHRRL